MDTTLSHSHSHLSMARVRTALHAGCMICAFIVFGNLSELCAVTKIVRSHCPVRIYVTIGISVGSALLSFLCLLVARYDTPLRGYEWVVATGSAAAHAAAAALVSSMRTGLGNVIAVSFAWFSMVISFVTVLLSITTEFGPLQGFFFVPQKSITGDGAVERTVMENGDNEDVVMDRNKNENEEGKGRNRDKRKKKGNDIAINPFFVTVDSRGGRTSVNRKRQQQQHMWGSERREEASKRVEGQQVNDEDEEDEIVESGSGRKRQRQLNTQQHHGIHVHRRIHSPFFRMVDQRNEALLLNDEKCDVRIGRRGGAPPKQRSVTEVSRPAGRLVLKEEEEVKVVTGEVSI